jgi:hypothetical protein
VTITADAASTPDVDTFAAALHGVLSGPVDGSDA